MRKKFIALAAAFFVAMVIIFNAYLGIVYHINIFDLFSASNTITEEDIRWLNERGGIICGGDVNAPPIRYVDEKTGQYMGFGVDFINALSYELGTTVSFIPQNWDQVLVSLENGAIDMCDMSLSEERAKKYLLSEPYLKIRGACMVRKDSGIKTLQKLQGKTVAALRGDYAIQVLKNKVPNVNVILYSEMEAAVAAMQDGYTDGVIGDEPVVLYFAKKFGMENDHRMLNEPIHEANGGLGFPKNQKRLQELVNKAIYRLKRKDTINMIQQKWFALSIPLVDDHTNDKIILVVFTFIGALFFMVFAFDIIRSELKRQIKMRTYELEISKNELEITLNAITYLMMVVDRDKNVIEVNNALIQELGMSEQQLKSPGANPLYSNYYHKELIDMIDKTFQADKSFTDEFEFRKRNFWVSTFPVNEGNQINRILIVFEDITRLRTTEKQLLQSSKMAAIGQLAAGVSHEIRNPLGIIRNYTYVLKHSIARNPQDMEKALDAIDDAVQRASDVIENLLNFSRISPNKLELINLNDFVNSIIKLERKDIERHQIEVALRGNPSIYILTNPEAMKHILLNLISNAVDAMPNGGLIKIHSYQDNNGDVRIYCIDNGGGMDQRMIEHIFDPFFTTKPLGKGTGMGLYIVYNQVQELGGSVEVKSKPGKGTIFKLFLPKAGGGQLEKT